MLVNHENPALETFREMWSQVYPEHPLPVNKPGRKSKNIGDEEDECYGGDEGEDEEKEIDQDILLKRDNINKSKSIKNPNNQINVNE